MSTAVLTPLLNGCLFELNGVTHPFDSYQEAEAEVLARGLPFLVKRFPSTHSCGLRSVAGPARSLTRESARL